MKIIQQMKCVYFTAKKHLSVSIYPDLFSLVTNSNNISLDLKILKFSALSLQESSENKSYGTYLNYTAARNFATAIVHVIEKELISEIELAKHWSIMIDESTSMDEKHLVIASQYIISNLPIIRYIGVIKLEDCRSEYIFEKLKNFISDKGLNIENIAYFGSDGTSTMIGSKTGVSTRLKHLNLFMTSVHCIAHQLHLAGQNMTKEKTNDEPQLCLLNIINTHWLSMSNTVHNLHQILDSVKNALNYDFITADN
ncbi:12498_t:CDS:2, partial [Cetraspora pellucida]